jgi:hypothetical protein
MRQALVVALLATVSVIACGQANGDAPIPTPVSPPVGALAAWAAFPAAKTPRPVVLIANLSPEGGFGTDTSKIAALCHKFTSVITLSEVAPRGANVSWSTGTKGTYPAISAAAALTAMTQPGPGSSESYCTTVKPVVFTAVRFGRYGFITDRGGAQMDSWLFTTSAFSGEMAYPAVAPPAIWNADLAHGLADSGSTLSADGLTLTFGFVGAAQTGACGADYRAAVAESETAVAIALGETPHSTDTNIVCDAVGYPRSVDVPLASPLGGRVVLDASGNFAPVCPAAKPEC